MSGFTQPILANKDKKTRTAVLQSVEGAVEDEHLSDAAAAIDTRDPNYDSLEYDDSEVSSRRSVTTDAENTVASQEPVACILDFKKLVAAIVEEYFISEDLGEMIRSVNELDAMQYHFELVKRSISMSLDRNDRERELVSRLLSTAYPDLLSSADIAKGFEKLFEMADELEIDAPNAKTMLSTFLARAVVDEVLPPAFLNDRRIINSAGEIVEHTKRMLSRDHSGAKLERIWGPGDGRPVEDLKVAVDQLLAEYLFARQLDEACRCVKELQVPHFHHEIVKRAVVMGMDKCEDDRAAIASLLAYLVASEVISPQQCKKGFDRLYELVSDLVLDTPSAPSLLAEFASRAVDDGCLPQNYRKPFSSISELRRPVSNGQVHLYVEKAAVH